MTVIVIDKRYFFRVRFTVRLFFEVRNPKNVYNFLLIPTI